MTGGDRSAQAALDSGRPAIVRLDGSRNAEDNAADLLDAWTAAQSALRAFGGGRESGLPLIHALRSRNLLTLDQAHALVAFASAAERAQDTAYAPSSADLVAARTGFQQLESFVSAPLADDSSSFAPPPYRPSPSPPGSPPPPSGSAGRAGSGRAPAAVTTPVSDDDRHTLSEITAARPNTLGRALLGLALLAVLVAGGFYAWQYQRGPGALKKATAAYVAGDRVTAQNEFSAIAGRQPRLATPHIYLGRMARESGDQATAMRELETAVRLEPRNSVALREMASALLAGAQFDLARKFYIRALEVDPTDRTAQGYLACALVALGRNDEARRFFDRAGPGGWTTCTRQLIPVVPPAALPRP